MAKGKTKTPTTHQRTERILDDISAGKSLRTACADAGITPWSFLRLVRKDADLAQQYTQAREDGADVLADAIIEEAAGAEKLALSGGREASALVNARRLKVDTLKWILARMHPKRYGDKVDVTSDGKPVAPQFIEVGGTRITF